MSTNDTPPDPAGVLRSDAARLLAGTTHGSWDAEMSYISSCKREYPALAADLITRVTMKSFGGVTK